MDATRSVVLILADISGYTRFMLAPLLIPSGAAVQAYRVWTRSTLSESRRAA